MLAERRVLVLRSIGMSFTMVENDDEVDHPRVKRASFALTGDHQLAPQALTLSVNPNSCGFFGNLKWPTFPRAEFHCLSQTRDARQML